MQLISLPVLAGSVLAFAMNGAVLSIASAQSVSVIPIPAKVEQVPGMLTIANGGVIAFPAGDHEAQFAAIHLAELLGRTRNLKLQAEADDRHVRTSVIHFERTATDSVPTGESYTLDISPKQVRISAASDAGLYYGSVTLWQLLTGTEQKTGAAQLQCMKIEDNPELRWRGIMLDSARHMQSIDYIRQLVEWMSLEKLNTLHWHLSDDQGWRLEIKRYPRLTSVGAYRHLPKVFNSEGSSTLEPGQRYGGFYTQAQVKELVKYAANRNVTIVPEIEMPGHSSATLAAYPQFGSSVEHLSEPVNQYGIFPYLYNLNDDTFTFIDNVLTEVMDLFPSAYIHVGGDEAMKDQWKASPVIQGQMKQLGIKDEDALQSYFIKRIDTFLTEHHRRTIGWDEILEGGLAPNAAVMSWHGVAGGIAAAKQGHDAVLTPVRPLYFNYRQTPLAEEAPGRFALNPVQDVYRFDPLPKSLSDEERKHILGVQANLWSEYVISTDRVTWMLFPRAAALAEIGWAPSKPRDWTNFASRLSAEMHRYQSLGIGYDPNVFRVQAESVDVLGGTLTVTLSNQAHAGIIRYTLDGSPVTQNSQEYTKPIHVPDATHLRAATFINAEIAASELDETLDWKMLHHRFSQELSLCANDPSIAMEQDPPQPSRPVVLANYKKPCWIYPRAALDGVRGITAGVMALPYVFHDNSNAIPPLSDSKSASAELQVLADGCNGKLLATLPLDSAAGKLGVTKINAALPALEGEHDLCLNMTRYSVTPLWVLDSIQLESATPADSGH